jgi:DNA-binding HxlR family transcriptional regulator
MDNTSTHLLVPMPAPDPDSRAVCLGPDGAVADVSRVIGMIHGRWKLPILFRLYADTSMRMLQLKRDMPGVSQKMLTQHLRELAGDGLIERVDFHEKPLRVEYRLSALGRELLPVLIAARRFAMRHAAVGEAHG